MFSRKSISLFTKKFVTITHYYDVNGALNVVQQDLTSHQTHYRSYRGRVFTGQMTQPTVSLISTEGIVGAQSLRKFRHGTSIVTIVRLRRTSRPINLARPWRSDHPVRCRMPVQRSK